MSTTVPQNIKGQNIMGRHKPTRNSLRHSRLIVKNFQGQSTTHKLILHNFQSLNYSHKKNLSSHLNYFCSSFTLKSIEYKALVAGEICFDLENCDWYLYNCTQRVDLSVRELNSDLSKSFLEWDDRDF